jgi:hypothetical protein
VNRSLLLAVGIASLLGAGAGAGPAAAGGDTGTAAYQFLNLGGSTRIDAMAGAGTAMASGSDALFLNPSLLAGTRGRDVSLSYVTWMPDVQTGTLGAVLPLAGRSAAGVAVRSLTVGDFGNVPGEAEVGQSDLAVSAAYGRALGPFDGGVGLRWIRSSVGEEDASGWSADAGLTYRIVEGWRLSGAIRNMGPSFPYGDGPDEELPTRAAAGLGATLGELRVDSEVLWENGPEWGAVVGAEYGIRERLFLRSGALFGTDADDAMDPWTAGIGIRVKAGWELDYSFRNGIFDASHRLGVRWAPDRSPDDSDGTMVRSPREHYLNVANQAIDQGLASFPRDGGDTVVVRCTAAHEAAKTVTAAVADRLRGWGLVVETRDPAPTASGIDPETEAPAAAPEPEREGVHPVLEVEIRSSKHEILRRTRARWVGPVSVERRSTVDLGFRLLRPGEDSPAWTGAGAAEDTETVAAARVPKSSSYPQPGAPLASGKRKLHPLVEPAIVGGIVAGLALIFFSNRDVGE